jgi:hypothetical protein
MAEIIVSKTIKCGFDSHLRYLFCRKGVVMVPTIAKKVAIPIRLMEKIDAVAKELNRPSEELIIEMLEYGYKNYGSKQAEDFTKWAYELYNRECAV